MTIVEGGGEFLQSEDGPRPVTFHYLTSKLLGPRFFASSLFSILLCCTGQPGSVFQRFCRPITGVSVLSCSLFSFVSSISYEFLSFFLIGFRPRSAVGNDVFIVDIYFC